MLVTQQVFCSVFLCLKAICLCLFDLSSLIAAASNLEVTHFKGRILSSVNSLSCSIIRPSTDKLPQKLELKNLFELVSSTA